MGPVGVRHAHADRTTGMRGGGGGGWGGTQSTGPYLAVPYRAVPCLTVPCRAAPCLRYEDVFHSIACPPDKSNIQSTDVASTFFTRSVARGAEMFDDTADNMTGIVVYLNPAGVRAPPPAAPTPAAKQEKEDASVFSV